jgi:hypothetical protein
MRLEELFEAIQTVRADQQHHTDAIKALSDYMVGTDAKVDAILKILNQPPPKDSPHLQALDAVLEVLMRVEAMVTEIRNDLRPPRPH